VPSFYFEYFYYYDVTNLVEWLSSDTSAWKSPTTTRTHHQYHRLAGLLTIHNNANPVNITASWLTAPSTSTSTATYTNGTLSFPLSSNPSFYPGTGTNTFQPTLQSLFITPNYVPFNVTAGGGTNFYLTGNYSDQTFVDLSNLATGRFTKPTDHTRARRGLQHRTRCRRTAAV